MPWKMLHRQSQRPKIYHHHEIRTQLKTNYRGNKQEESLNLTRFVTLEPKES
jgi:hypothetical protein